MPSAIHKKIILPFIKSRYWPAGNSKSLSSKIKKFITAAGNNIINSHIEILALGFKQNELKDLVKEHTDIHQSLLSYAPAIHPKKTNWLNLARYLDKNISLEGDMLVKVDRASMLCSLECRAPFLDHKLMEFSYSLPADFLIKGKNKKRILKDSFADLLPAGFMNAPKMGFEIPVADWFRNELKNDLLKTISEENLKKHGFFKEGFITKFVEEHLGSKQDHSFKLLDFIRFSKMV